jgi:hypothetical protein
MSQRQRMCSECKTVVKYGQPHPIQTYNCAYFEDRYHFNVPNRTHECLDGVCVDTISMYKCYSIFCRKKLRPSGR